jgi:zinc-ribbon domain
MFCDRCGTELGSGDLFCSNCGKPVQSGVPGTLVTPTTAARGRVESHIRVLGILWIVLSAFRLLPGLFLISIFQARPNFLPPEAPDFVPGLVSGIGILLLVAAAFGIFVGWGLLQRQPWARMGAIVFSVINLFEVPFGTALGIYTLWVLLPAQSEAEYRSSAVQAY